MVISLPIGSGCVNTFQTDVPVDIGGDAARTANPVKTTGFFGVKEGCCGDAAGAKNTCAIGEISGGNVKTHADPG